MRSMPDKGKLGTCERIKIIFITGQPLLYKVIVYPISRIIQIPCSEEKGAALVSAFYNLFYGIGVLPHRFTVYKKS